MARKKAKTAKATKGSVKRIIKKKASGEPKVLVSPDFHGKPVKQPKDTYPEESRAKDFRCFGPAATHDGEFESARICDLGCFTQDGKDSNKYYHGAVVQHRKSKNWYSYFEWGRTGGSTCSFQFVACQSESDARGAFARQLHAKNDKRGEWVTVAGIRTLQAKKGKDCYLVRPMATRTTGLPDARNIKTNQKAPGTKKKAGRQQSTDRPADTGDPKTLKLLRDLRKATIAYTQKSMADASIPTQRAVNEARSILADAQTRVGEIDDCVDAQVSDRKLMRLTELMFSRIPRKKRVGAAAATWVLSRDNIQMWHDDLNAFESALYAVDFELNPHADILAEMELEMNWVDPDSQLGQFIHQWWPAATSNRHRKIKSMTINNLWQVNMKGSERKLSQAQKRVLRGKVPKPARPAHQPRSRSDLPPKLRREFKESNTALLFHGTRSVNVSAILRSSLRMPDALVAVPLTGAKFGSGVYFSDDWQKSADYTNAKGSAEAGRQGAIRGRKAFMFALDVVLGNPHVPKELKGYAKPPRGCHSVFAKAGQSGVADNEYVVYKTDQYRTRYLIEFATD